MMQQGPLRPLFSFLGPRTPPDAVIQSVNKHVPCTGYISSNVLGVKGAVVDKTNRGTLAVENRLTLQVRKGEKVTT